MNQNDRMVLRAIRTSRRVRERTSIQSLATRTGLLRSEVQAAVERLEVAGVLLPDGQLREPPR